MGTTTFVVAFAMGIVMAPATDAVTGAVPEGKAGVGTAIKVVARMVAGTLGAAVTGSVMYTIYKGKAGAARATRTLGATTQVA